MGKPPLGQNGTSALAKSAEGPWPDRVSSLTRDDYIERVVRGGFPDAISRAPKRRATFLTGYVADLINRDLIQLSEIERGPQMHALVEMLAARSGQPLAPATLASELGIDANTVKRYLALLEEVFLIKRVPAWTRRAEGSGSNAAQTNIHRFWHRRRATWPGCHQLAQIRLAFWWLIGGVCGERTGAAAYVVGHGCAHVAFSH